MFKLNFSKPGGLEVLIMESDLNKDRIVNFIKENSWRFSAEEMADIVNEKFDKMEILDYDRDKVIEIFRREYNV